MGLFFNKKFVENVKEINGKNKLLFCLLSIGLFVGFYFGEDSSGGGSIVDFASTWPLVENLFYYDGALEIKFPLHYYIASLIYYIVADKEVLRLIYVTASIFIPLLFYRCLKEKYSTNPKIKVIKLENKKICQSEFWYAISINIGNSMAIASIHKRSPII